MRKWMRRIRGAIGMGFTWAVAWAAAGMVPRWVFGFNADVPFPLVFGSLGFMAGVIFSGLLMLTEGRRGFEQMTLPRFAAWGAVGGFLLSAIFTRVASLGFADVLAIAPTFAVAGAICASGSLALARRAEMRELPDNRGSSAEAELADHKKRQLL
jgi:FtsH-binding integral membrane protein